MGTADLKDAAETAVMSGRRAIRWAAAAAILAALLVVGLAGHGSGAGRPAPALPRQALAGSPVTLPALLGRAGGAGGAGGSHGSHGALVVFWASWCTPCRREAPAVESFARGAGRGRIVGVDYGESEASGPRAFLRRYAWSFPVLSDPNVLAAEAYGVVNLPTTFAIDPRGRIHSTLRGPQSEQSLARALAAVES